MHKVQYTEDRTAPSAEEHATHDDAQGAEEEILLGVLVNSDGSCLLTACDAGPCPDIAAAVFRGGRRECLAFIAEQLAREIPGSREPSRASEPLPPAVAA